MQSIFKNPLAEPGLLGVNQAAGFGAALGILIFKVIVFLVQLLAFSFGIDFNLPYQLFIVKNISIRQERLVPYLSWHICFGVILGRIGHNKIYR